MCKGEYESRGYHRALSAHHIVRTFIRAFNKNVIHTDTHASTEWRADTGQKTAATAEDKNVLFQLFTEDKQMNAVFNYIMVLCFPEYRSLYIVLLLLFSAVYCCTHSTNPPQASDKSHTLFYLHSFLFHRTTSFFILFTQLRISMSKTNII